ncbi:MAG: hypothetical protein PWP72_1318 [Thermoanaerobacter sp.]|jgi:protein-S-isoprenylcysteine O-methyltransferase Ste14|nr:hypothetical protein [Thermoanaerobacter sp.]
MGDNNKKWAIANKVLIVFLILLVFVLIALILAKGFVYFETRHPSYFSLALCSIAFLWLNEILILLKLEQISLRDRMIDPILVRRLSNIIVIIAITILIIIILLIVKVFFVSY